MPTKLAKINRPAFWKRFALLWIPCCAIVLLLALLFYRQQAARRKIELLLGQRNQVALQSESIQQGFNAIITDLNLLAEGSALRQALENPTDEARAAVQREFMLFSQSKQVYDQVRLIDADGRETIRVNLVNGRATLVERDQLQLKSDRDYFRDTAQLPAGAVYLSRLDLNVENGEIELPWKPTLRLATPMRDADGTLRAVVVLNYLCHDLLARFRRLSDPQLGDPLWLDQQGYWLSANDAERAFGFMFPERSEDRFDRIDPEAWSQIASAEQGDVQTGLGTGAFQTITPGSDAHPGSQLAVQQLAFHGGEPHRWKIVAWLSSDVWWSSLADLRWSGLVLGGLGVAVAAGICGGISWYSISREAWSRSLRESEARFRQMADSIVEVFWLSGRDRDQFLYVSPAFERIWGVAPALEQVGAAWSAAVMTEDRPQLQRIRQAMERGEQFSQRYRIVRPDGEIRWIWDQGFPVRDSHGISRYAGIAEDVTNLQAAQDQLLQSERLVAMGEAITSLAHESRNALQRSQACLDMLSRRLTGPSETLDLARRGQAALGELRQLYERLQRFAAPVVLDPARGCLAEIWDQAVADLRPMLEERRIVIARPLDDQFDTRCQVDLLAVRQVYRNLIENAADSIARRPDGSRTIEVRWEAIEYQDRPAVKTLIQDTGSGIDGSMRERMFDPFQTSKPDGTGLGLAIARRLVEAHQGLIEAHDRLDGPGLVMEIVLPRSLP